MIWMLRKIKIKILFLHREIPFSDTHILEDSQKKCNYPKITSNQIAENSK